VFVATEPVSREAARRLLGLPLDAELVLFAGLIEAYKGLSDLIDAFGQLAARRPNARLVIAGKPNQGFEVYDEQLRARGLLDRTILDLAFLPESRLAAYLCAADVVALPYRSITSSGQLFAARRFACPIVATNTGDLLEVVTDGENGLLVPPANPDALAHAIERLLTDRDLAARIGKAGQRAVFGAEGWPVAAERTVAFYRQLLLRS
jgi:glycosyltransferase involved in cell wall biosynthesis